MIGRGGKEDLGLRDPIGHIHTVHGEDLRTSASPAFSGFAIGGDVDHNRFSIIVSFTEKP